MTKIGFRLLMILSFVALITARARAQGQDLPAPNEQNHSREEKPVIRRLERVTWNPVTHEITWMVSAGDSAASYEPRSKETYIIDLDSATMRFHGEDRKFSGVEAARVRALMDVVSRYAVESTVWWEDGLGDKVNKEAKMLVKGKDVEEPQLLPKRLPETAGKDATLRQPRSGLQSHSSTGRAAGAFHRSRLLAQ